MSQRVEFTGLTLCDGATAIELTLVGTPATEIDAKRRHGDVMFAINGKNFETAFDLELPQARTVAAAILALADYVDAADHSAHKEAPDAAE